MVGVEMKNLIDKCNIFCTQALNTAAGLTVNRGHYEVSLEHFLLACLEEPKSDIALALEFFGGDIAKVKQSLNQSLEAFRSGNPNRPVFSPLLQEILEASWLVASVDVGLNRLRSGALLLAYLRRPSLYSQGNYSSDFAVINRESFLAQFGTITASSVENAEASYEGGEAEGKRPLSADGGENFMERFCEDFTEKAKQGKIDPVFGRDDEIRQMVDILARRRKNNPILVGDPGVGKTAVMEGLALRIVQGDVPETLEGVRLMGLDMGLLEAGASMKGEFERRLKGVLDEIKASTTPIILFIDEAHLLVGAGGNAGGSDAANLMKPALARGEIRTCAATTWKEYKKYFEKDPALARRFQLVKLDEPSVEVAALILRGIRDSYEKAHGVLIRDDALQAAAEYAGRYITGRFLPDKAIDLLDTACARVKVGQKAKPALLEDTERASQARQRELDALLRDADNGLPISEESLENLRVQITELDAKADEVRAVWQRECEAAQLLIEARLALYAAKEAEKSHLCQPEPFVNEAADISVPEDFLEEELGEGNAQESHANESQAEDVLLEEARLEVVKAREALDSARKALLELQGDDPLVFVEVSPETIGKVVSDWTGIPVGKLAQEQASMVADLGNVLGKAIKGQDAAIHAVVEGIQASKAGLRSPDQPMGVFLLVGPSGVGKTETGLRLADALFGDERSVITINMSEFQEKHTVSRLIGSPPGYVGYGEGGMLTEAVRRRPYSVVLLDEVEKAHKDVMQLFYQVFDKGTLTDGEGTEVNFRNTVILLTSNLASDSIQQLCASGLPSADALIGAIRPVLSQHFQPALLARMHIVPYGSLQPEALKTITTLKLDILAKRLYTNNKIRLVYDDKLSQAIASRCLEVETGARNIDYIISANILPQLSKCILEHMADGQMPREVHLEFNEEGALHMRFVHEEELS